MEIIYLTVNVIFLKLLYDVCQGQGTTVDKGQYGVLLLSLLLLLLLSLFLKFHHHHHISVMELGHLLTRSGLTYPEVSSKVCHDSFCHLENSVSLPWVIYYEAFYLHAVSSFSCTPVICPKLVLFLIPL